MKSPNKLYKEARDEGYIYFDKNIRPLPKKPDGSIDTSKPGFHGNDVDAFRHAYVSGIFTYEYGETIAAFLGWMNEFANPLPSSTGDDNMDLWNNKVGRELALQHKSKNDFAKAIKSALENGELITIPSDSRVYEGASLERPTNNSSVIVLKESKTGANEIFFDLIKNKTMTREEFVAQIDEGIYQGYTTRMRNGLKYPSAKSDDSVTNNLG